MEKKIICGVYKITNPSGQIYIGSSKNILVRWDAHRYKPKGKMLESIKKYGHKSHVFEILEICQEAGLKPLEREYQNKLMCFNGFNLNIYKANNCKYINGKRQRIESMRKRYYFDAESGVYYETIAEIAILYSINVCTLSNQIMGYRGQKNGTKFILA